MQKKSRITRRVVSSKRHTLGFVLDGNTRVSRAKAISLARNSQLSGVRVVSSSQGEYLQSTTSRNLYDLPMVLEV